MPNDVQCARHIWTNTRQEVLFDNEKWLDSPDTSLRIPQDEIQILKFGVDRFVYKVIVSMIFMLRRECVLPIRATSHSCREPTISNLAGGSECPRGKPKRNKPGASFEFVNFLFTADCQLSR